MNHHPIVVNGLSVPLTICLGRKIATLRRQKGYSQRVFADEIGISSSYLAKLECGKGVEGLSLEVFYRISQAIGLPPEKLIVVDRTDYVSAYIFMESRLRKEGSLPASHHALLKKRKSLQI